jgi:pre-mRNA-splicing factor 38A
MANKQMPGTATMHGTQAQFLLEKILRDKIYANRYWNEQCFGLSAETILERATNLKYYGGK